MTKLPHAQSLSVRRESDPHRHLGKVACNHYTTDAFLACRNVKDQPGGWRPEKANTSFYFRFPDFSHRSVGPVRVELTTSWLRARCFAFQLQPHASLNWQPGNRTQRVELIRPNRSTRPSPPALLHPPSGPGGSRTQSPKRLKGAYAAVTPRSRKSVSCCRFQIAGHSLFFSSSVVALRIERSATRVSGGLGQPALDYRRKLSAISGQRSAGVDVSC